LLEIRSNGDLRFFAGNNNPVSISSGTGVIVANKDHFIEVSRVGGTIRMFVDGNKKEQTIQEHLSPYRTPPGQK